MVLLLEYELAPDYLERRGRYRDEHLRLLNAAAEHGELILAGALADPSDRSLIVWRVDRAETVEDFVRSDPYVANGLVRSWSVRTWMVAAGIAL